MANPTVEFDGCLGIRETSGGALIVDIDGEERCIPMSLIHDDSEVYKKDTEGTLIIPEWFAVKEGLV